MCSESHRVVRSEQFCIFEDEAKQGFQQLVTDTIHWLNEPVKRDGNFHFIVGLKIVIVTILIAGFAWFAWFLWRFIYTAMGGV